MLPASVIEVVRDFRNWTARRPDVALIVNRRHVRRVRVVGIDVVFGCISEGPAGIGLGLVLPHAGLIDVGVVGADVGRNHDRVGSEAVASAAIAGMVHRIVSGFAPPSTQVPPFEIESGTRSVQVESRRQAVPDLDVARRIVIRFDVHLVGDGIPARHGETVGRRGSGSVRSRPV